MNAIIERIEAQQCKLEQMQVIAKTIIQNTSGNTDACILACLLHDLLSESRANLSQIIDLCDDMKGEKAA